MKTTTEHKAKLYYTLGSISLLLFIILTAIIKSSYLHTPFAFDQSVQNFAFHLQSSHFLVTFFSHFTNFFGDTGGSILAAIVCLFLFFIIKEKISAIWLGILVVASTLCNTIIKSVIGRVRPDIHRLAGFTNEPGYSFASGHSTFTTVLFGCLFLMFLVKMKSNAARFGWGMGALVMILLVMFSRIFVGVHYPTDTVGGFLEGLTFLMLTYPTYLKYKAKKYSWKILN